MKMKCWKVTVTIQIVWSERRKYRDKTSLHIMFHFYEKNAKEGLKFYLSFHFCFILWRQNQKLVLYFFKISGSCRVVLKTFLGSGNWDLCALLVEKKKMFRAIWRPFSINAYIFQGRWDFLLIVRLDIFCYSCSLHSAQYAVYLNIQKCALKSSIEFTQVAFDILWQSIKCQLKAIDFYNLSPESNIFASLG